jgi:predicted dehydrogenase/threonine dehydrogenase-like Zn-dependent dehydrogenase
MKQIIQDLKSGRTILEEVPAPKVGYGKVLIQTSRTLVSLGTERMLVEFGKANYIEKARQQPDKVKMVLDKVKTDGLKPTYESVVNKLGQPLPLGYCNVGRVIEVGEGVNEFKVGDRVASNGVHSEFVCVAKNLIAKIPDTVSDDEAAFTVIGAIALQGVRLANPTLGETIVVVGMGLIGLVTSQLLLANGCNVIGIDVDQSKLDIAKEWGVNVVNPAKGGDSVKYVESQTEAIGADAVIITASSKSNDIIHDSALMSRKRGRIVLVGVIGLDLRRDDFFKKELTFQVSSSYGPGRYDEFYEANGNDYPIGFVRWTEKRNFEAILNSIATARLNVKQLITERVKLEEYGTIYGDMRKSGSIASIIEYALTTEHKTLVSFNDISFKGSKGVVGIIGAGNFTSATILPRLSKIKASLKYIASEGGLSSTTLAKRFNIANATSDYKQILQDSEVDLVLITTRHGHHAKMTTETLKAGKHVFVEKPLALNNQELDQILDVYNSPNLSPTQSSSCKVTPSLTVGFNRRFAPLAIEMKKQLGNSNVPMNIIATMNAGFIPPEVWVHDLNAGGGRIIGEACHFIDLCTYLAGSKVKSVVMNAMGENPQENTDNATILLKYENGTNAVINYFANGSKSYSKERLEVFSQDKVLIMDNWRKLKGYGFKNFSSKSSSQDKGHANQFDQLIGTIQKGGKPIIPLDEIINTTKASFAAIQSLKEGKWINI